MAGWLETCRRIIDTASSICSVTSQVFTGIMIFLVAADATGRYVFNRPIPGVIEITELMMVFIVFLVFAYVEREEGHVRVDLVISRLPRKVRPYIECFGKVVSLGVIAIIVWQSILYSQGLREGGNVSAYWGITVGSFLWVVAFGCLLFCFQLVLNRSS